jgi:ATP-binding cassette, subfamily B, multidrug efflux pump
MTTAAATPKVHTRGAPRANLGVHDAEEIFLAFDTRIIQRFGGYLAPYKGTLWVALAVILLSVGTQVAIPMLVRYAVDSSVAGDQALLHAIIYGFAALVVVHVVGFFLESWVSARLAQKVIFDMRRAMFAHLQNVSLSFMDQTHVGRVMSRLQGDVNALQEFLESSVAAVGDLILLVGIVAVLLWMDWQLGLLTLLVLPALIAVRAVWLPRVKDTFRRARDASSIANGALAENINGVRTVQESRREAMNLSLYKEKVDENFEAQVASAWATQVMVPTVEILTGVAFAIVIVVGGNAVIGGTLEVGVMVAYIFYVQRFFEPIRTLSQQYTIMQRAMAAGYRIFEVLDVPVTIKDKPGAEPIPAAAEPSIEFRNVTFGYKKDQPILQDVSLTVEPRQVVALVGPTGSGKTSITALAHRFYDVWSGEVRVGGRDVRDVTLDSLGRTIGMVLQEPFLFSGSIYENIRYASGASREAVTAAAKSVRAHDFIMRLPDGYDTMLGQRGRNLSVGQRQLISFARALVANPQILVLDEATANIDSFTELEIQRALKVLFAGRTSLVIAHRLATIRGADKIIVLQKGCIVEEGDHDSLLARGGLYASLHAGHYASFDDVSDAGGDAVSVQT